MGVIDGVRVHNWRHLANAIELSMCGGDATLCQITLTTCCYTNSIHNTLKMLKLNTVSKLNIKAVVPCNPKIL